jgi:flavodoxin
MKAAIILYYSRFGNTERIAKSLEAGMKKQAALAVEEGGVPDTLATISSSPMDTFAVESLQEYDLICVGAPTEAFTTARPAKEFLARLKKADLAGKYGFAFDTKLDSRLSGSAAKHIEKELASRGLAILMPRQSAIVLSTKKEEKGVPGGVRLKEEEEERFVKIGEQLARALTDAKVSAAQA